MSDSDSKHSLLRRVSWNPLVVALPMAYLGYTAFQNGFTAGRTAAAGLIVIWFVLSVFDLLSRHRLLDWKYSDEADNVEEQMDDASIFRVFIEAHGGRIGKPSANMLDFLREKGLSQASIEYISRYNLKDSASVNAITFYGEAELIGTNADDFLPIALRDGLLAVGTCPNGDQVAVDVRDQLGAAGYIGHESMWQKTNVREVFKVLAPGLGTLAAGLHIDAMPLDYCEALKRE